MSKNQKKTSGPAQEQDATQTRLTDFFMKTEAGTAKSGSVSSQDPAPKQQPTESALPKFFKKTKTDETQIGPMPSYNPPPLTKDSLATAGGNVRPSTTYPFRTATQDTSPSTRSSTMGDDAEAERPDKGKQRQADDADPREASSATEEWDKLSPHLKAIIQYSYKGAPFSRNYKDCFYTLGPDFRLQELTALAKTFCVKSPRYAKMPLESLLSTRICDYAREIGVKGQAWHTMSVMDHPSLKIIFLSGASWSAEHSRGWSNLSLHERVWTCDFTRKFFTNDANTMVVPVAVTRYSFRSVCELPSFFFQGTNGEPRGYILLYKPTGELALSTLREFRGSSGEYKCYADSRLNSITRMTLKRPRKADNFPPRTNALRDGKGEEMLWTRIFDKWGKVVERDGIPWGSAYDVLAPMVMNTETQTGKNSKKKNKSKEGTKPEGSKGGTGSQESEGDAGSQASEGDAGSQASE